MRKVLIMIAAIAWPTFAYAGDVNGVWKTEKSDYGGYLEVTMGPCKSDAKKTCGIITAAFDKSGRDPDYKNLGKLIVSNMESKDGVNFSGGTIWDPEENKTYKSKMTQ